MSSIFNNSLSSNTKIRSRPISAGWIIWGCAALFYCYQFILRVSIGVLAQNMMLDLNLNEADFGIVAGGYYCAYALMQIPLGLLSDKYDMRNILLGSIFITLLGTLILGFSNSMTSAYIGRLLIGFGSSAAFLNCLKSITEWFPPSYLPIITGMTVAFGTIGANLGGKVLAFFSELAGWRYTLLSFVFIGLMILSISWLLLFKMRTVFHTRKHDSTLNTTHLKAGKSLICLLKNRQVWLIALLYFFVYTPLTCLADTWGVSYLMHVHHITIAEATEICLSIYIGVAIGTPIIGYFSNKIKSRRKPIIICSLISTIIFLAIFNISNLSLFQINILFICLGFFVGGQKLVFTIICELTPKNMNGVALGFVNSICMFNGFLLPSIIGKCLCLVRDKAGTSLAALSNFQDYSYAFIIPTICLFLTCIMSFFIKETFHLLNKNLKTVGNIA